MIIYCVIVILLLTGAQSQCYTSSNCTGDIVPADNATECCGQTSDGQSYGVGPGDCEVNQCIGEKTLLESVYIL